MKLHDVVVWPRRWVTRSETQNRSASVLDGVLLDIHLWQRTSKITLVVQG